MSSKKIVPRPAHPPTSSNLGWLGVNTISFTLTLLIEELEGVDFPEGEFNVEQ